MRISVVVPVYNAAPFLRECLDSLVTACQDAEDGVANRTAEIEIVCVDDGSTDDSAEILEEYARNAKTTASSCNFKVLHQQNSGVSAARNTGIKASIGDYVMFADADDGFVKGAFRYLFNLLNANPGVDIVRFSARYTSELDKSAAIKDVRDAIYYDLEKPSDAREAFDCCVGRLLAWNGCFKRDLTKMVLFQSYPNGEDTLFGMECFCRAKSIVATYTELYQYVENRVGSAVHTKNMRHLRSALAVVKEQCATLREWPMRECVQATFYAKQLRSTIVGNMWMLAKALGGDGWQELRDRVGEVLAEYPECFSFGQRLSVGLGLKARWLFYLLNRLPFEVYVKLRAVRYA